jgi:tetratricopeptide (TPR) repeat protein
MRGNLDPVLHSSRALGLLEAATARDPADVEAWQARGHVLILQTERWQALTAFEAGLRAAPDREMLLASAAAAAQMLNEDGRALALWRRAVAANPWLAEYRAGLAPLLAAQRAWAEAREECQAWVLLDPESVPARRLWIECLLRDGRRDEARAQFAQVEALAPPDLKELRAWFARQLK